MTIKMSATTRNKIVQVSSELGFRVDEKTPGEDWYEKNITISHVTTGKTIYIRKTLGQKQDGSFDRLRVAVHPADFVDLDAAPAAEMRIAIHRTTGSNDFLSSNWRAFPPAPDGDSFRGKCYEVSDISALRKLLQLVYTHTGQAKIQSALCGVPHVEK